MNFDINITAVEINNEFDIDETLVDIVKNKIRAAEESVRIVICTEHFEPIVIKVHAWPSFFVSFAGADDKGFDFNEAQIIYQAFKNSDHFRPAVHEATYHIGMNLDSIFDIRARRLSEKYKDLAYENFI